MKKRRNPKKSRPHKPKQKSPRFGLAPKKYNFAMNPYPDARYTKCPICEQKTGQRKLPLFIHIDPAYPIALNYTCRYCSKCDLLIGHQAEFEELLTKMFSQHDPTIIGNDYLIMGTMDRKAWKENMANPKPPAEMLAHISDFKSYQIVQRSRAGWFPEGVEPPFDEPPPSVHWIKHRTKRG